MDTSKLTLGDVEEIAELALALRAARGKPAATTETCERRAVVICTKHQGVIFGYATDTTRDTITLEGARFCLYWAKSMGGVLGLSEIGPNADCRIGITKTGEADFADKTCVMSCSDKAEEAWLEAPVQGIDK